jgi:hypothetical protein
VPAKQDVAEAVQVELAEPAPAPRQRPRGERCPDCGEELPRGARWCPACRACLEVDERDDEWGESGRRAPRWKACPKCGRHRAKQVTFTFWGSFYGPALLSHVRCRDCGYTYNGRTGKSNFWPAFFFVMVPAVLLVAIIGGLAFWIWYLANGGPG